MKVCKSKGGLTRHVRRKHSSTSAVSSSGNDDHIPCYITEEKALTMIKEIWKCIADGKFYPDEKVAQVAKLRPSKSFLDDINTLLHRFHCKNDRDRLLKDFFSKNVWVMEGIF